MFDYKDKTWGSSQIRLFPQYLQYLKLKYFLKDIKGVKGKVLDIGCGGGNMVEVIKFYRSDLEILASDISPEAIKRAKKRVGKVKFLVADACNLPLEDKTFVCVTMFDLLEHIRKPKKAIAEASRVLKPGGVFILFVPLENQPLTLYWLLYKLGWRGKQIHCGHIQRFDISRLRKIIEKEGFAIAKIRFSFHLLGQFLDIGFDFFLAGKLKTGLEEHLEKKGNVFLRLGKDFLVTLANLESQIFSRVPTGGVQLTCIKGGKVV